MKFRFIRLVSIIGISCLIHGMDRNYAEVDALKNKLIEQYKTAIFIAERLLFTGEDVPGKYSGEYFRLPPQFQVLIHTLQAYQYIPGEDEYIKITLTKWPPEKELYIKTEKNDYIKVINIKQFPYEKHWIQTVWLFTLLYNEFAVRTEKFRPEYELRNLYDYAFVLTEFVHELGKLVPSDIPLDSFILEKQLPSNYKNEDIPKYITALQRIISFNETTLNDLKKIVEARQPTKTSKKAELIILMKKFGMY